MKKCAQTLKKIVLKKFYLIKIIYHISVLMEFNGMFWFKDGTKYQIEFKNLLYINTSISHSKIKPV